MVPMRMQKQMETLHEPENGFVVDQQLLHKRFMAPMCVRNSEVEALHVQGSAVIFRRSTVPRWSGQFRVSAPWLAHPGQPKPACAQRPATCRPDEIRLRTNVPQPRAQQ